MWKIWENTDLIIAFMSFENNINCQRIKEANDTQAEKNLKKIINFGLFVREFRQKIVVFNQIIFKSMPARKPWHNVTLDQSRTIIEIEQMRKIAVCGRVARN